MTIHNFDILVTHFVSLKNEKQQHREKAHISRLSYNSQNNQSQHDIYTKKTNNNVLIVNVDNDNGYDDDIGNKMELKGLNNNELSDIGRKLEDPKKI